jgi:hypothetical protein
MVSQSWPISIIYISSVIIFSTTFYYIFLEWVIGNINLTFPNHCWSKLYLMIYQLWWLSSIDDRIICELSIRKAIEGSWDDQFEGAIPAFARNSFRKWILQASSLCAKCLNWNQTNMAPSLLRTFSHQWNNRRKLREPKWSCSIRNELK